jgi:hypothetical protein
MVAQPTAGTVAIAAPGSGAVAEDPEMVALRAYAAEVVRSAGGLPAAPGYRPRLEPVRPALSWAPLQLLTGVGGGIIEWIRRHPLRTLAAAVAGSGAIAGVLLLPGAVVPGDASLELANRPAPAIVAVMPAPAPLPAADPFPPAAAPDERPPAPIIERPAPREAQRHGGRRMAAAMAGAGRTKTAEPVAPAHPRPVKTASAVDRRVVIAGIQAIQPLVNRCARQHGEKGVASVAIEVGSRGEVKRVTIAGPLAGTRAGACLKAAVKTARFREGGLSFQYPFVLQ